MTTDNLEFWNKVKQVPPEMLKEIKGGRLKGKSDISPQWRYQVMTEHFGMCGVGWKYEVVEQWISDGSADQKCAFVNINLFINNGDGEWSDAIPGTGGSMLVEKETSGLHTSDEAFKMATTDALSVAMKLLGVAADVYAGLWDGSKYLEKPAGTGPKGGGSGGGSGKMSDDDAINEVGKLKNSLSKIVKPEDCAVWWKKNGGDIAKLPKKFSGEITKAFTDKKASIASEFYIDCIKGNPEKPEKVLKSSCEGCKTRKGCPSWAEEDK